MCIRDRLYAVEPGMTEHDDSPDADEKAVKKLEIYTDPPQSEDEQKCIRDRFRIRMSFASSRSSFFFAIANKMFLLGRTIR